MDWFRSWHNAPTDPKWLLIARKAQVAPGMVSAVAWALMDYASQNEQRGSIDGFDPETYASWAGWNEADVIAIMAALRNKGVIADDGRLAAWDKRQPKREDNSGPRVKAFRDRQRALQDDVTQCNATEHTVTQSNHRSDQIREDKTEMRDRPPSPAPIDLLQNDEDPEWQQALAKLDTQWLGSVTGSVQLKLARIWPQMSNGRRAWLDDAIAEAAARNARTPDYAITVLSNALRDNKRPGETPEPARRGGFDKEAEYKRKMEALLGD